MLPNTILPNGITCYCVCAIIMYTGQLSVIVISVMFIYVYEIPYYYDGGQTCVAKGNEDQLSVLSFIGLSLLLILSQLIILYDTFVVIQVV